MSSAFDKTVMQTVILYGLAVSPAFASGHTLHAARLTVGFATASGLDARDGDRVDSVVWTRSDGSKTGNLAVNSTRTGQYICGDPAEFFGQSVGGPFDNTPPLLVQAGDITTWRAIGTSEAATRKTGNACGYSSAPARSQYRVFNDAFAYNELEVTRIFEFGPTTPVFQSDLRAYVPRIDGGVYKTDLIPDTAGLVRSYDASACGQSCTVSDWNGRWIAEDDGAGNGMVIIRSLASRARAVAVVDSDSYSDSNASAVMLTQPAGGWRLPVVEVEYLCFYDATSWPRASQSAGRLPDGCQLR